MPLTKEDREFMRQVVAYFESTKSEAEPEGSIRETAQHFMVNRSKVRKILISAGLISSPITEAALALRRQGLTVKETAAELGISASTVSMYLPYTDKVDNSLSPSPHAARVREYRAYEKQQAARQVKRNKTPENQNAVIGSVGAQEKRIGEKDVPVLWKQEWEKERKMSYTPAYHRPYRETWKDAEEIRRQIKLNDDPAVKEMQSKLAQLEEQKAAEKLELDALRKRKNLNEEEKARLNDLAYRLGCFPGALDSRNQDELEKLSGEKLPFVPMAVMRLHMELCDPWNTDGALDEETTAILQRYGEVERGTTISRDIIVPSDLPLYALHYVIQKVFGWQNSHLHQYSIPLKRAKSLCHDNASMWSCLVGLIFRSPLMGEEDEFWADDYTGGSFKNWLRKKYTGPYLSLNHGEGLLPCQEDMMRLGMKQEYEVWYKKALFPKDKEQEEEYISHVLPVKGRSVGKAEEASEATRAEYKRFEELPVEALGRLFERDPLSLIERLPIDSVLYAGKNYLGDLKEEEICQTGEEMYQAVGRYIHNIIDRQEDTPEAQVCPVPFTDVLYYTYDFGDDWKVRITASWNCTDLMDQLTQTELDKAQIKCREVYRPVLIARDGQFVMDDVGGIHGYLDFLQTIHPDLDGLDEEERAMVKQNRKEYLIWAKGQGWKKDDATNLNFF